LRIMVDLTTAMASPRSFSLTSRSPMFEL
jgi:hypothetical protein